jgi:hypothetical protein
MGYIFFPLTPTLSPGELSVSHIFFCWTPRAPSCTVLAMVVCGRVFPPELLQRLEQAAVNCSRRQLAQQLCQWLDWRGPSGQFQLMAARKALAGLVRRGTIHLRPAQPFAAARPSPAAFDFEPLNVTASTPLSGSLGQFQPVQLVLVPSRYSAFSRQWKQLMQQYHYLGAGPLCGAQLRYLIRCPQGLLGALAFSAAAWRVTGRDQWIGWSEEARRENLHLVLNNSRFLILPHVQVPDLASHVLAKALSALPQDWQARYGYSPVLVETFVERQRFHGGCYRAANWQALALTTGRGRQDSHHQGALTQKVLWVYPLRKDFRQRLCQRPQKPRLAPPPAPAPAPPPPPPPPQDWAEAEFAQAALGDRRLRRRLCILGRDRYARPTSPLPEACGNRAKTKAAYRFLDNPRVSMQAVLHSHYQASAQRLATEKVVLAVQDTTSLNYSAHPATEMLGPIGSDPEGAVGLLVHSTLAFNPASTPLGLLNVQCWARDPEDFGKKHRRYQLPLEAKESVRWLRSLEAVARAQATCPNTQLVSVGDRESDIYELFVWANAQPGRPALLVRAERDRLLADSQEHLWTHVQAQASAGTVELKVPRRGQRPARVAKMEVHFAAVDLRAPKRKANLPSVRVWAVLARETQPPAGVQLVQWMLLTTLPVEDFEQAVEKLRWYALRWGIEVFHRVLKSGCQIETRQLAGADRLEACLAIDLVVAWRIYHLTKLGRETPEVPCTVYFEEHEWQALVAYIKQSPELPAQPPSLREAVRMVASLGGFLERKSDGDPGTQATWIGLQRLDDLAGMYLVLRGPQRTRPTVSSNKTYG